MIKNYFKTAWRNIFKNGVYTIINITGLATGLASFILILLYLNYELSYDKWDASLEKVYKVSMIQGGDVGERTPAPLASFFNSNSPNVEAATAISPGGDFEVLLAAGEKKIYQKAVVEADSLFLKVFPYKLSQGNALTALNQPNAIVLSEELGRKLFGNSNPMGQTIKIYNSFEGVVTGIMMTPASPAHLDVQMIMRVPYEQSNRHWQNFSYQTYIKLRHPVKEVILENDINSIFYNERIKKDSASYKEYKKAGLQTVLFTDKVVDLHNFPKYGSSNFRTVAILLLLATLLLIAGAINFSNLSIAASIRRSKEVGVRKVLGSSRVQLFWQFMSEIALQCMIGLGISLVIVYLALPWFKQEFNIGLTLLGAYNSATLFAQILGCLIFVIIISGLYPSVFLSRFNTTMVLKGNYSHGKKGTGFRNVLIIAQFVMSVFFILSTLIIGKQMRFMLSKDKGFSGEYVVRIDATQKTRDAQFATTRNLLLSIPGVENVAKTTNVPGDRYIDTSTNNFKVEGKEYRLNSVKISSGYFKTLNIGLIKGRLFTENLLDENTRTAIINETGARMISQDDPVGKTITFPYCDSVPLQIVGVVKDFNVQDFSNSIKPVVYTIGNNACRFQSGGAILVKLNSSNIQASIAGIEQLWKKLEPDFPVKYSFLDDNFQKLFASYTRVQKIISFFALIAIVIAAMGLFALTAFLARQRTKEIGIRKVLGAGMAEIIIMISKDFLKLLLIAALIAMPLGWWAATKWLQTFVYRVPVNWVVFVLAIGIVFVIALITIGIQTVKAARANPVKSLRTE